jgi:hypothetical protein
MSRRAHRRLEAATSSPSAAHDLDGLLSAAEASAPRSLNQLAADAARQVPACSGAAVAFWRDGEPAALAASHPSLPALIEAEVTSGRGPALEALRTSQMVGCPDTLAEDRWPEYCAAALRQGVRCSLCLAYRSGGAALCLSLFSARPRMLGPQAIAAAERLAASGMALVGLTSEYGDARREQLQLRDAAQSRAQVDQAKGVLMHALHCSADQALEQMRQISQARNMKVADVAARIITSRKADVLEGLR